MGMAATKQQKNNNNKQKTKKNNNKLLNPCTNLIEFVSLSKMSRYNFILINFCAKSACSAQAIKYEFFGKQIWPRKVSFQSEIDAGQMVSGFFLGRQIHTSTHNAINVIGVLLQHRPYLVNNVDWVCWITLDDDFDFDFVDFFSQPINSLIMMTATTKTPSTTMTKSGN